MQDVRGKRVVEIACGIGTDGVQFARAGAEYIGVDLTPMGSALTYQNLAFRGLTAHTLVGSVEHLPLGDASVDLIHSHGVIHHTPDIEKAYARYGVS